MLSLVSGSLSMLGAHHGYIYPHICDRIGLEFVCLVGFWEVSAAGFNIGLGRFLSPAVWSPCAVGACPDNSLRVLRQPSWSGHLCKQLNNEWESLNGMSKALILRGSVAHRSPPFESIPEAPDCVRPGICKELNVIVAKRSLLMVAVHRVIAHRT